MPTRKQRRRRDKDFRHDVRVFEVDEEGNEVPIAELRAREEKPKAAKAVKGGKNAKGAKSSRSRTPRAVAPPSWDRALKRGGAMGGLMLLAFLFLFKTSPLGQRLAWGIFYAVAFVPLTYWIDRTAYRNYQRRVERQSQKGS
jgi:hypothetical protein